MSQSRISPQPGATRLCEQNPEKSLHIVFMNRMPVGNTPLLACAQMEGRPGGEGRLTKPPTGGSYKEDMPV